jgi:RNA polymerase sigma-70 factor (ECF subfamily)
VKAGDLEDALEKARLGDELAVSCLFKAFYPALMQYVKRHAPGSEEDLVSETWLSAARGLHDFTGSVENFRAWLFLIARRRIVDFYRSRARSPQTVSADGELQAPNPLETADVALESLSTDQAISALVRDLSPDQAEVVLLRVVAGLSVEEVAQIMGKSPGSVRVLQHRALRRLARIWERRAVTR